VPLPVSFPAEGPQRLGLSRFCALQRLTLIGTREPGHHALAHLPLGLRELTLVAVYDTTLYGYEPSAYL